jgi:formylglycine-generating enzyme required for sulfatase activity
MSAEPAGAPPSRLRRLVPYALIGAVTLFCHGLILTNDGTIWDSWYVLNFLQTRNWFTMHDFFSSVGMPLYDWLYRPFALAPDIVAAFMLATFLCLLANGVLIYRIALEAGRLTRDEALALALLAQAMPLFSAAQDFIMFFFVLTHTLFLAAALLAVRLLEAQGRRRALLRALAVLGFAVSFTNAALLVFYGCCYLLLFFRHRQLHPAPLLPSCGRFVARYPDLLLLPPLTWLARGWLTPQYGWYAAYNNPTANLPLLLPNFLSFFRNALPYHLRTLAAWPLAHPLALALLAAAALLAIWRAPAAWRAKGGPLPALHLAAFGALALVLAIFPFAAAGKLFLPQPVGEMSRHSILAGLPLALLLLVPLRLLLPAAGGGSRWFAPVAGFLALVLGSQLAPVYLNERAEWVYSRAVLQQVARSAAVRASSVVVLQGYSVVRQDAYALYGFATAFGDMTRLVTAHVPANRQFFTPAEIEGLLAYTTLPSGDFRRIDPSGQQLHLVAERTRPATPDAQIVSRYLRARYLGTRQELESYLATLVAVKTAVLRPPTPLAPAAAPAPAAAAHPGADMDFTNGAGMRLVRLPEGRWASALETTQAQYQRLMGANPSLFVDPARPVDSVSWDEAAAFCRRLTDAEAQARALPAGFVYRLPTAQEFEQLAAGTSFDAAATSTRQVRWQTAPAGSLAPNGLGLYDVVGNVWEWCLDWADADRRFKVSRGGSWVSHVGELSAPAGARGPFGDRLLGPQRIDYPNQGFWDRGFRCVLAPAVDAPAPRGAAAR